LIRLIASIDHPANGTNPGGMPIMVLDGIGPEQPLRPDTPRTPRRD